MEKKGFFTIDAVIAVMVFVAFLALFRISQFESQPLLVKFQAKEQINDIFKRFDENATILSIVDQNIPTTTQIQRVAAEFRKVLPSSIDFFVSMKSYSTKDLALCRQNKNFVSCLTRESSDTNGIPIPSDKDVIHERMIFVKKRALQTCSLEAGFSGLSWKDGASPAELALKFFEPGALENRKNSYPLFSSEKSKIFFGRSSSVDNNITFTVDINGSSFSCDEDIRVDMNAVIFGERPPIDLMLVMDRSGSMSWSGTASTGGSDALWLDGNYVFHEESGTRVRDVNVFNPLLPGSGTSVDPGTPVDLYGTGNALFVVETSGTDELYAYNISNPASPVLADSISINAPRGVFALGNYVYVTVDDSGTSNDILRIVDATDINNLVLKGSVNLSNAQDVFVVGNTAYVARGIAGLSTVDVSNPNTPLLRGTVATGGTVEGVVVDGGFAFVAMGSAGVASVNVSDINNITLANTFNTPGNSRNLFVQGNELFVADETSTLVFGISNPNSMVADRNFASPYDVDDVFVRSSYAFLATSLGMLTVDIVDGPRINNAKVAAKLLIDYNGWKFPPDQMGEASFSSTATLDKNLTTDKNKVKNAVNNLVASGSTNIEAGIDTATAELYSARANPTALKFQVLLTDGQQTFGDAMAAARRAKDKNIRIYTIGFGEDADASLLQSIATLTDANYHHASDKNALNDIFLFVAKEVGLVAQEQAGAIIKNVTIDAPIPGWAAIKSMGDQDINSSETLVSVGDKNYVRYSVIPKISNVLPWKGFYVMALPCNAGNACDANTIKIPDMNTRFSYKDSNAIDRNSDFNARVDVNFSYRDLTVKVPATNTSGLDVVLDINAVSSGFLSTGATSVNVCKTDNAWNCTINLRDLNVPAFACGEKNPACPKFNSFFDDETFANIFSNPDEIVQMAVEINKNKAIRECPNNNLVKLNCATKGNPQYFVLDLYAWLK